ncbi:MAG: NCS2 family permease [Pirellulales bacterium]|nr:NCS2 family permease [Pirellulales bacterium]
MLERFFQLRRHGTTVRTEVLAGVTTFLTMAYIIFVQPAVLSGSYFGKANIQTGLDFGAVTTATCLAAALATAIMALLARYPIGQAPGMGENFVFVLSVLPAADTMLQTQGLAGTTTPWQVGLGVVFIAGLLFLALSLFGIREVLLDAISPSMRNAIAIGIGLFIAFLGLEGAGLVHGNAPPAPPVTLDPHFNSPDLIVFFFGLFLTGILFARRVRGAIVLGILGATLLAVGLRFGLPLLPEGISQSALVTNSKLMTQFQVADHAVSRPPSLAPTLLKMDLVHALSWQMVPFILIFLFMDVFDTLGTLVGVSEQAGLIEDGKLPRAKQAFVSDAVGTVAGAAMGTSTVTSFIESAAGVEQGGRTGLTALVVSGLFLLALFFSPVIAMIGSYPAVTAPALVVVGSMMIRNVTKIDWSNYAESLPCFLIILGIPLTYSIPDGLGLGLIAYPIIKLATGQGRQVKWPMYILAVVMVAYFICVRARLH